MILQSVQERRGRCACRRRHSASARGVSVCHPVLDSISTSENQRHHQTPLTAAHKHGGVHNSLSLLLGHQSPQLLTCKVLGSKTQMLIKLCRTCPMQVLGTPDAGRRHRYLALHISSHVFARHVTQLQHLQPRQCNGNSNCNDSSQM